jgi:hypothetical protein
MIVLETLAAPVKVIVPLNVGLADNTTEPVPVEDVTPVPPLPTERGVSTTRDGAVIPVDPPSNIVI